MTDRRTGNCWPKNNMQSIVNFDVFAFVTRESFCAKYFVTVSFTLRLYFKGYQSYHHHHFLEINVQSSKSRIQQESRAWIRKAYLRIRLHIQNLGNKFLGKNFRISCRFKGASLYIWKLRQPHFKILLQELKIFHSYT